ncbi:MAG: hypothetical protein ACI9VS_003425, partial [Candidatus Binatia bacterium]
NRANAANADEINRGARNSGRGGAVDLGALGSVAARLRVAQASCLLRCGREPKK